MSVSANLITEFKPLHLSNNIINYNADPFGELDLKPSLPFSNDSEEIIKNNNSLFQKFLEVASKESSKESSTKPSEQLTFEVPRSSINIPSSTITLEPSSEASKTTSSKASQTFDARDANLSLEEILTQEGVHYRITSGYRGKGSLRNGLTKQGKRSNHNRLDERGNPMAYDVVPNGVSWKQFKKEIYGNPRIVNYLKLRNWGILDETRKDVAARTGATGPHLHIGADTWAKDMLAQYINNPRLWSAAEGIKVPVSEFTPLNVSFETPKYFKASFGSEDPDIKRRNREFFSSFFDSSTPKSSQTETPSDPLLNSPFYLGNNIPTTSPTSQQSQQISTSTLILPASSPVSTLTRTQKPDSNYKPGKGSEVVSKAITNLSKEYPDIERYRDILLQTAERESRFNLTASNPKGSAYGLFQMIDSTRRYYAPGLSKQQFGNSAEAQVKAAYKMLKDIFSRSSAQKLKNMGLNDMQIATLGWLGVGYMDKYAAYGNAHFSDKVKRLNGGHDINWFINKYS